MANTNKTEMVGRVFGELTVIRMADYRDNQGNILYVCGCSCGGEKVVRGSTLRCGITISCGCKKTRNTKKHGMEGSPTYTSWSGMKSRCRNPNDSSYEKYGGRGINVCDDWLIFENFLRDMGVRMDGTTLDRIDVNGDYCKKNCRWASKKTQSRNRRNSVYVLVDGCKIPVPEYAEKIGRSIVYTYRLLNRSMIREGDTYMVKL